MRFTHKWMPDTCFTMKERIREKIIQELKMFVDELDQAYIMYSFLCIVWFVLEEWICLVSVD